MVNYDQILDDCSQYFVFLNQQIYQMKLKTPTRPNFSRYAKLCDQTFYHDSGPLQYSPANYQPLVQKPHATQSSTYGFSSIPREKRGNFRFPIRLPHGQFTYYPNHLYGRNRSPTWSFSKKEKYGKDEFVQYQLCPKNPFMKDSKEVEMRASCSSLKEAIQDKVKSMRSTSYITQKENHLKETKTTRNYSIIDRRETSSVGFFNPTKIAKPRYIAREDLNKVQSLLDEKGYQRRSQPRVKGYIQFHKKRSRRPNNNSKGFETVLYPYEHQQQFNNFQMTKYPITPEGHIDMTKHLERPDYTPNKLGPNTSPFQIDYSRPSENKINLILQSFRDRVTTRYDRVGPEPNTVLDYYPNSPQLGGMVQMDRMIGRSPDLFPIIDPIIKKAGDNEMKQELKTFIPIKQINEALRPKNVQDFTKLVHRD